MVIMWIAESTVYNEPVIIRKEVTMVNRKKLVLAATALIAIAGLTIAAIAQSPPPVPDNHPVPVDPNRDAATCWQCHQSVQAPAQDRTSFCNTCHVNLHVRFAANQPVVQPAPDPPHTINMEWTSSDCASCHRQQHNGKNATHGVTEGQQGGQFCATCHVTGDVPLDGDEPASFCARCHNLGVVAQHPSAADTEGQKAEFCTSCHEN